MKKFHFPLEKARSWRRLRLEQEESKLDRLQGELKVLGLRRNRLDQEEERAMRRAAYSQALPPGDLAHLAYLRDYAREERRRLAEAQQRVQTDIERQREAVRKARQEFEMLDRLRDQQHAEWTRAWEREQETQIGEMSIARWSRSARAPAPEKR